MKTSLPGLTRFAVPFLLIFLLAIVPAGSMFAQNGVEVLINEMDADQVSTDAAEFVELFDGGVGNTDLSGMVLVFFNGSGDVSYQAFDLDGYSTGAEGYFVLCGDAANVSNCDLDASPDTNLIQNGADAIALFMGDAADFPANTPVTTESLLDAIVYDTSDADDAGLLVLLNAGQPQVDENGGGDGTGHSSQRCPNGEGGARNTEAYLQAPPTAGAENDCEVSTVPEVSIYEIQYTADPAGDSPYTGQTVRTRGVVTGFFGETVFIQDGPGEWNGLMLYRSDATVNVGDLVEVEGPVSEYFGMTEIAYGSVGILSTGNSLPAPEVLSTGESGAEAWESIFVRVENVTVTQADLGYGEWEVDDGSGGVRVDDMGSYAYVPMLADALDFVQGPLNYAFGDFKIEPRDDGDLALTPPPPPPVTLHEIQYSDDPSGASPYQGQTVITQGVVTALFYAGSGVFIQDGAGPWNGLYLYKPDGDFEQGDLIQVEGVVDEYFGLTQIAYGETSVLVAGAGLPQPETLSTSAISDEAWESVLVRVENVTVTDQDLGFGEWKVDDGSGGAVIDDMGSTTYVPADGDALDFVIGPVYYGYGTFKIEPRDNADIGVADVCGNPFVPIYDVQGAGPASPFDGSVVSVEGVVTGDFQAWYELSGFFMQDLNGDGNPATSDGVFVYERYDAVSVGDHVRVTGNVDEYYDLTEITSVDLVQICGAGVVPPAEVSLPLGSVDEWEQYEGMLVHIPQTLTATDNYNQGLYGEVTLSAGGRLYNPTGVVAPGSEANALQDLNNRRQIQLEDGSTRRNPSPVPYVGEGGTLRAGDTIPDLTGVVHYNFETYEIHPTSPVTFTRVNARQESPSETGGGVEVASFNVLNYFTTIDDSGPTCGPSADMDCRGADTAEEFTRQRDKIISAIAAMDAEVVGLMELENHPTDAALQDLVNGLNDAAGAGAYSYIPTGPVGTDAIKVAFIYQTAAVQPVGGFAILDSSVDPAFLDTKNRPALAQTFEETATGARFTAVVNHLKSKGSDCNDVGDPDTGDGQGNCNLTRTQAAEALVNWLSTDPTRMGDPDSIIIGDLNSYAMEDPVGVIQDAGYTNLVEAYGGAGAYSYIYFGQAGYLDHALSNSSLTGQVQGAEVWHINSDEPSALDYNDYNQPELYQPGPYRSSDHDPVMVGLDLVNQPPVCSGAYPGVDTIWPANHKFVPVEILGVYDPDGNGFAISIDAIYQDEPVDSTGDGAFVPDGLGLGMPRAVVRAERDGAGNGRVYHIFFTAEDHGNTCKGEVTVGVPKSQKTGSTPIDEGALYDSFFLE